MADVEDVAIVIQAALGEIGLTGTLGVSMDGQSASKPLGRLTGNDVDVAVVVEDLPDEGDARDLNPPRPTP